VADIFGDRTLYRAGFAVVALAFVGYNWFFVSLVGIDSSSQDTTLVTLLLSIVIIVELLAAVRQRGREALVRQNNAQLLYEVGEAVVGTL
jgi:K+-sensing histidine kinase KdpD